VWALQRLREARPLKAAHLAEHFEVSLRTAYRDIDFLRDAWRVDVELTRAGHPRGGSGYQLTSKADVPPAIDGPMFDWLAKAAERARA
jgi:predicted DNA-binding transcriptional regulator YafY